MRDDLARTDQAAVALLVPFFPRLKLVYTRRKKVACDYMRLHPTAAIIIVQ